LLYFFFAAILWSFGANSKPFQEVFAASQSLQLVLTFGHQLRPPNSQKLMLSVALLEATIGVYSQKLMHIIACKLLKLYSLFFAL